MNAGSAGGGKSSLFPNRPDHPDFERLAKITRGLDAKLDSLVGDSEAQGNAFQQIVQAIIDGESLSYLAINRGGLLYQRMGKRPTDTDLAIAAAVWVDAFVAGVMYERGEP